MRWVKLIGVLVWKDFLIDLRRKENVVAMFFFALLTLLIFRFALGDDPNPRYKITGRVLQRLEVQLVNPDTISDMSLFRGRVFTDRVAFIKALNTLPGGPPDPNTRIAVLRLSQRDSLRESAAGLLWVTLLLAGVLGLSKSFNQEKEHGCMDGLLLTPVSRGVLYLGKMISNTLFLGVILVVLLPLFALFFQVGLAGVLLPLVGVLLAGVLGFSALGTLLGGITASLKGREVLLPILLFPLLVPIVISAVHLTGLVLDGGDLLEQAGWLRMLAAFDGIYLIVSYLAFDYVMES